MTNRSDTPLLQVRDLTLERGSRALVAGLTFSAARGELLQVVGPNGAGKSTLLRAIAGLHLPESGTIAWNSERGPCVPSELVSYLGHLPGISSELSGAENLEFAAAISGQSGSARVAKSLGRVNATKFSRRPVRGLSAGQRQRIALARVLLLGRPLWLLDEPFTSLDSAARELTEVLLEEHLGSGGVIVMATHQRMALRMAPREISLASC